jgi:hypothetical protein
MVTITVDDLLPFAPDIDEDKAAAMIDDALAMAALIAPCILADDFVNEAAAKAIIRRAILRWHDTGSGVVSAQAAGPFSQTVDTRQPASRSTFTGPEKDDLQRLCAPVAGRAFEVDLTPAGAAIPTSEYSMWSGPDQNTGYQ